MLLDFALVILLVGTVAGQRAGTLKEEVHLPLTTYTCIEPGNCQQEQSYLVAGASGRYIHTDSGIPCFNGSHWNPDLCPDPDTCTENCLIEGFDSTDWANMGVSVSGSTVSLRFVTITSTGYKNVGGGMYFLDSSGENYRMYHLLNRELTFDVDLSEMECGMNAALYFSEMDQDGGKGRYPTNQAGAKYGTGYCDAQCPRWPQWINGKANSLDWDGSRGHYGSCCAEMDILEANSQANQLTTHASILTGQTQCEGNGCAEGEFFYEGPCDKEGCEFNPWKNGNRTFYGRGSQFVLDTSQPMTMITQFVTSDGTDDGDLVEIRRIYVQNGRVIENSKMNFAGVDQYDSIRDDYCGANKDLFGYVNDHQDLGGLKQMGESLRRGMVLIISLWEDSGTFMHWLDSNFPDDADPSLPGVSRGPCPRDAGNPSNLENNYPNATLRIGNIRFGSIGSTYTF